MKQKISFLFGLTLVFFFGFLLLNTTIRAGAAETDQKAQRVTLKIDGVDCGACVKGIRSALMKIPGVTKAEMKLKPKGLFLKDYSDTKVVVEYEQGKTTNEQLIKAVEGASNAQFTYKATLME